MDSTLTVGKADPAFASDRLQGRTWASLLREPDSNLKRDCLSSCYPLGASVQEIQAERLIDCLASRQTHGAGQINSGDVELSQVVV
jgi:hypothetical protein